MQSAESTELREIVIAAARHVLPTCGLNVAEPVEPPADGERQQVVAFMGFTGDALRGTIAVVAPFELFRASYPLPLTEAATWRVEVFDWAGEVANRVLGRIRTVLEPRGVHIEASTPRVMQGEHLHLTRSTQGTICSACFPIGDSCVRVWFDAISADDSPLFATDTADGEGAPAEGEPVLF